MNKSLNYIKVPIILISATLCIAGIRWMISSEPRILDQVANEERLEMSFVELFLIEGNLTLSEYLKQIYRFLGFYVFGTGLTFMLFTTNEFFQIRKFRTRLLYILGFLLISNLILAYYWIPSSHFIYLMWGAICLFMISCYGHFKES